MRRYRSYSTDTNICHKKQQCNTKKKNMRLYPKNISINTISVYPIFINQNRKKKHYGLGRRNRNQKLSIFFTGI